MKCLWVVAFLSVFPGSALGRAPSAESLEATLWSDSNHDRFTMRIETEYWTWEPDLEAWMVRQV